jgi:hypothetical protein
MIKRYRHWLGEEARHMVETFDGEYVLYEDHLAVVAEKDREIERLKSLVADLTVGCMDNVEVKEDSDG